MMNASMLKVVRGHQLQGLIVPQGLSRISKKSGGHIVSDRHSSISTIRKFHYILFSGNAYRVRHQS